MALVTRAQLFAQHGSPRRCLAKQWLLPLMHSGMPQVEQPQWTFTFLKAVEHPAQSASIANRSF